jgi:hypothetical protein
MSDKGMQGRKMKGKWIFAGLFLLSAGMIWASGRKGNELRRVENPEGFTESLDIGSRKPGKYNFYIEAEDRGGNTAVAGPHNLFIDPESDLPVVLISNPRNDMRVPGNLTIAGTCVDDDGVDRVELIFNDDPGTVVVAEGKEFWSWSYETTAMPDNLYSITAYGVDSNGLRGKPHRVSWHLDRQKPEITVESPESGALTNGKTVFRGTVRDGNGIEELLYSTDNGKNFTPLSLKHDKRDKSGRFEFNLDTRQFEDGPAAILFRAKDKQGSEGSFTRLIFADNTGPEVEITWPGGEDRVNGKIWAAGFAKDTVGLKSLSWKLGKKTGSMELVVGNPWWVQEFDLGDEKGSSADLEIRAEDLSGNVSVARRKFRLDQKADLPRIILSSPAAKTAVADGTVTVTGRVEDDDGVESILWSLDGGSPQSIRCSGAFNFSLRDLPAGVHTLSFRGRDINGLEGPWTEVKGITVTGGSVGSGPALVWTGEDPDGKWVRENLEIRFGTADRNRPYSPEYSLDLGKTWKALPAGRGEPEEPGAGEPEGEFRGMLDLSALEDGLAEIHVRARDGAGNTGTAIFRVCKDTQAPAARLVVPLSGSRINGILRLGLAVEEKGALSAVEYLAPAPEGQEPSALSLEPSSFINVLAGTAEIPLSEEMRFRFTDAAGNQSVFDAWPFVVDGEPDLPVVTIGLPRENEVFSADFAVSGIMYDDDKAARIWYRIDGGDEVSMESEGAWSIPLSISDLGDNEHTITVTAEDIYGVRGNPVERNFRVSKEDPRAEITSPRFDEVTAGMLTIRGTASDANTIEKLQVSLDNGISFNDAAGTEEWEYTLNTKVLQDGTHVVLVRVRDAYGVTGFCSGIINIDNTAPKISLESPLDGATTAGPLLISGQTFDETGIEIVTINIYSLEDGPLSAGPEEIKAAPGSILNQRVDLSSRPDGLYNIDVWASDAAKNTTHVSRNIRLARESAGNFIDCLYPMEGEHIQGSFNLYGYAGGTGRAETVTIRVNGVDGETVAPGDTGFFRFTLPEDSLVTGTNTLAVYGNFGGAETVVSPDRTIEYRKDGPWVRIDSLAMGDFAFDRPWLSGSAGYRLSDEDREILSNRKAKRDLKEKAEARKPKSVDLSFDNGRTFVPTGMDRGGNWRYRLETQDMPEGLHYLIVRALMENGETAVSRTMIQVDQTPPVIRLAGPRPGERYNQSLEYSSFISDDSGLKDARYTLRKGDKAAYEVPGFIQGLYFDGHFWGASLYDVGMGLSFFDDNVKFQVQYGQFTQEQYDMFSPKSGSGRLRYGGDILGLKLLANVYSLPFSRFLGSDWSWLSASAAIGANFSLFSETQNGSSTWLSAILGQIEFPRITIPKRNVFRTYSLYTEFQLWFVPTDVNANETGISTVTPHITVGLRINVF